MNKNGVSLKLGFIGLGMGGCAIATACTNKTTDVKNNLNPYRALLINTNINDLNKINVHKENIRKLQLEGYEQGAGRNVEVGEQAFKDNEHKVETALKEHLTDRDFIFIVCGLGGGTGTGALLEMLKMIVRLGFSEKFGLILTLPRKTEGTSVLKNALDRAIKIMKNKDLIGGIVFVDNDKLYNSFENENINADDFASYSNNYIANAIHSINTISNFTPFGDTHFDGSELLRFLSTSGCIQLANYETNTNEIDVEQKLSYISHVKNSFTNGVLVRFDEEQLKLADKSSLSVCTNEKRIYTLSFMRNLDSMMNDLTPIAEEKPVSLYDERVINSNKNRILFVGFACGLPIPSQIVALGGHIKALDEKREIIESEKTASLNSLFDMNITLNNNKKKNVKNFDFNDDFSPENKKDKGENPFSF